MRRVEAYFYTADRNISEIRTFEVDCERDDIAEQEVTALLGSQRGFMYCVALTTEVERPEGRIVASQPQEDEELTNLRNAKGRYIGWHK